MVSSRSTTPLDSQKLTIKVFARQPIDPKEAVEVFHRWIQQDAVPGVLIAVADYSHIEDGPGVMLVGHEANYAIDRNGGQPGLVFTNRRGRLGETPRARIFEALKSTLNACVLFAEEVGASVDELFDMGEIIFGIRDRLAAPNSPLTFNQVKGELTEIICAVYGGGFELAQRECNQGSPFELSISVRDPATTEKLLSSMGDSDTGRLRPVESKKGRNLLEGNGLSGR